jgi:predicted Rdx family selenoprotein
MAGEALSRRGDHIEIFRLIPSVHGKFDIRINDELVGEHKHLPNAHLFPDLQDLIKAIDQRIKPAASDHQH